MAAQDNAALARRLYDLFNQGQLQEGLDLAASDVEVVLVPFGQRFHGRAGFMDFHAGVQGRLS
jgi:ketosteroid isomerase-like protein